MGKRIGNVSRQGVVLFVLGVLVGALLVGDGSLALSESSEGVQAQGVNTWQSKAWHG